MKVDEKRMRRGVATVVEELGFEVVEVEEKFVEIMTETAWIKAAFTLSKPNQNERVFIFT